LAHKKLNNIYITQTDIVQEDEESAKSGETQTTLGSTRNKDNKQKTRQIK
jgi:ATP-dependent protease HslVU (ClpYQ) peptidase subunit